jgi:hypothetical protein
MIHLAKHAFRNPESRVLTAVAGPSPGNPLGIAGCRSFPSASDRLVNLQEHLRNILNVLLHRRVIRSLLAQAIVCLLLQRHNVSRTQIKTQGRSNQRGKESCPKPNNIMSHAPDFIVKLVLTLLVNPSWSSTPFGNSRPCRKSHPRTWVASAWVHTPRRHCNVAFFIFETNFP